ncbi:MAG: glycogen debranching enzyme family protein [Pyrinomonadaceae bacterium]|nr:glycogen debranching enzyme family protein [Pyrinomonadaceae bacterium]
MISFDSEICTNYEAASEREWLETNGIGGFASATISGANTRRYHGILTSAIRPPLGRITMLSKFEETLSVDGETFELSANQYPNAIYPNGYKYLKSFRLDPFPVWTFEIAGIEIEKKLFMAHGENTTIVQYRIKEYELREVQNPKIELALKPLLSFVDYHHLQRETADFNPTFESSGNSVEIHPFDEMPSLFFDHNAETVEKTSVWYRNFEYAIERTRGFDFREDLFQPFVLKYDLTKAVTVIVSTEKHSANDAVNLEKAEIERRGKLIEISGAKDDFTKQLVLAADQFIVSRGDGKTIIAGYPWFSDWGRDTMIALNGLTLATNRAEIARQILLEFSKHISQGMIPNRFPDIGDEAEYNTVDATLWYFEAIRAYAEKTKDYKFVREYLYEKLANIIEWHLRGTRFQIHVDTDGLLYAGTEGVQLTWMDAKYGDEVFTPRIGKPVEIQALWFNALKIMANYAERFDDPENAGKFAAMAELAKQSFNAVFWNEAENCLFDVVINGMRDSSVRPNQIFAVSLPNAILDDPEKARKIVEKVETELLTPFGLRSLSPNDVSYCPIYTGSPYERDSAYHQGTVWVWLIGGYVDARRKVFPDNENRVEEILAGFKSHLTETGCGQISEIFDGDAPHKPRGCFAQAWSVAEILRVFDKD